MAIKQNMRIRNMDFILFIFFITGISACSPADHISSTLSKTKMVEPPAITAPPPLIFTPTLGPAGATEACDSAFTFDLISGSPAYPMFGMIQKVYEEGIWKMLSIPLLEDQFSVDPHTLICVRQDRIMYSYYHVTGLTYPSTIPAYTLKWDVRLVQWPERNVIGQEQFTGGPPPRTIIGPGPGYGSQPLADLTTWLNQVMGDQTILSHPY